MAEHSRLGAIHDGKKASLLKSDSPLGTWELTEAGTEAAKGGVHQ